MCCHCLVMVGDVVLLWPSLRAAVTQLAVKSTPKAGRCGVSSQQGLLCSRLSGLPYLQDPWRLGSSHAQKRSKTTLFGRCSDATAGMAEVPTHWDSGELGGCDRGRFSKYNLGHSSNVFAKYGLWMSQICIWITCNYLYVSVSYDFYVFLLIYIDSPKFWRFGRIILETGTERPTTNSTQIKHTMQDIPSHLSKTMRKAPFFLAT